MASVAREVWKDIPEHQDYQASSLGRIRSIDRIRVSTHRRFGTAYSRKLRGKILRQTKDRDGYHLLFGLQEAAKVGSMYVKLRTELQKTLILAHGD